MTLTLRSPLVALNLALGGLVILLVLLYVLNANAVTANRLLTKSLNDQVLAQSENRTVLMHERTSLEDPVMLTNFAQGRGMVETAHTEYVFEGTDVAYRR